MERRTLTTLGQLRVGDIFHFPKQEDKFQVIDRMQTHTSVNKPDFNGGFENKFDDMVRNTKQVIFLRHTRPEPGEQCLVQDLQPGEVFHTLSDVIKEYTKDNTGKIVSTGGQDTAVMKREDRVVFVRKQY